MNIDNPRHHDYPCVVRNGQYPSTFTYQSDNRWDVYRGHAVDRQQLRKPRLSPSAGPVRVSGGRQLGYSGSRGRRPIRVEPRAGDSPSDSSDADSDQFPSMERKNKYIHGSRRRGRDWNPSTSDSDGDHESNWSNWPKHGSGHRPYHHACLPPFTGQE